MSKLWVDHNRSGIEVHYTKRARTLFLSGWYDSIVGIEGREFTLLEFLDRLGVSDADLRWVLRERTPPSRRPKE